MKHYLKIISVATSLLALSAISAIASPNFNLVNDGEQVCKVNFVDGVPDETNLKCFPIFDSVQAQIEVMQQVNARIDFIDSDAKSMTEQQLKSIGGANNIELSTLINLKSNYDRISISNFAINPKAYEFQDGIISFPFFASVSWQGRWLTSVALATEGYISFQLNGEDLKSLVNAQFSSYSDAIAFLNKDWSRYLNTSARSLHFQAINGFSTDVSADTKEFLNVVIAPVLIGEAIHLPLQIGMIKLDSTVDDLSELVKGWILETFSDSAPSH